MVEINAPSIQNKIGAARIKKDLRIDMTPMVDLGFLLIAFFIFTTEISRPAITNLYMPKNGVATLIPESKSLTILLDGNNQIFYYYGTEDEAVRKFGIHKTSYHEISGLGNIIRGKQIELKERNVDKNELIVLIKPGNECSYKNLVDVLDDMLINRVSRYRVTDMSEPERLFLRTHT